MSFGVARIGKINLPVCFNIAAAVIACILSTSGAVAAQQPILPVDFRPFVDGRNWIVRQPLVYTIGVSKDSHVPSIRIRNRLRKHSPDISFFLRQNGSYLLPAVVHDYLYWKQTCTRDQSDQILRLGMIENQVPELQRVAIYGAVRFAGGFAGKLTRARQAARLLRIIPPDRLNIGPNKLWPDYQRELFKAGVVGESGIPISMSFCARGDLPTDEALGTK